MRFVARTAAFFFSIAGAAQIRHPVVQEIVGLRLQRVGADRDDRVGEFGVFVAVVELAHAHVARAVHLAVVGRAIVDADVLDLHALEIELAGRPRCSRSRRRRRHDRRPRRSGRPRPASSTTRRVTSATSHNASSQEVGVQHAVAPDQRFGQPFGLRAGDRRNTTVRADLGAARSSRARSSPRSSWSGMTHEMHVAPVLLDDVVHRRARTTPSPFGVLLLG